MSLVAETLGNSHIQLSMKSVPMLSPNLSTDHMKFSSCLVPESCQTEQSQDLCWLNIIQNENLCLTRNTEMEGVCDGSRMT